MHIVIEYRGSDGATVEGEIHCFPQRAVMPSLARKLIREGRDPDTLAHVLRDGRPVFVRDLTLGQWAAATVEEGRSRSIRFARYRPCPR